MAERRPGQDGDISHQFFGGLRYGDVGTSSEPTLPPLDPSKSIFATLTNQEFELVVMAVGALVGRRSHELKDYQEEARELIQTALNHFGLTLEKEEERVYAFEYILTTAALARSQDILRAHVSEELKRQHTVGTNKLVRSFSELETTFLGKPVNKPQSKFPQNIKDMRLSTTDMIRVRDDVERTYRVHRRANETLRDYPIDDENSAVPALSGNSTQELTDARRELDDSFPKNIPLEEDDFQRIRDEFNLPKTDTPVEDLTPEQLAKIEGFGLAVRDEIFQHIPIPERVDRVLKELDLTLDHPLYIEYALVYIKQVASIKRARVSSPEEEIEAMRRDFASIEATFEAGHIIRLSREEITQVRNIVEEAFRKNPHALGGEADLSADEQTASRISDDEYRKLLNQARTALGRARTDATTPGGIRDRNRLVENLKSNARQMMSTPIEQMMERETQLIFATVFGDALDRRQVPELLALYRIVAKGKPLPGDFQSFLQTLNPEKISDHVLRQVGIKKDDLRDLDKRFGIHIVEADPASLYRVSSFLYLLVEALDVLRLAKFDFTDRKFVEESKRFTGENRGFIIGSNLFGLLRAYIHPDTIDSILEASGFSDFIESLKSSQT